MANLLSLKEIWLKRLNFQLKDACEVRVHSDDPNHTSNFQHYRGKNRHIKFPNMKVLCSNKFLSRRAALFATVSISQISLFTEFANSVPMVSKPQTLYSSPATFARIETLLDEAIESWERGLDPTNLTRFKDLYQACRIFDQIVALDPDRVEWLEARGQVEIDAKKFAEALDDCDEVIKRNPSNYRTYASRALAYEGLADWDMAINDYSIALSLGQKFTGKIDPYFLNSRGNVYSSKGFYEEALKDYDESARLFQASRELDGAIYASSNAALTRIQLGDIERGMKELATVARRAPASIDMRAALSALYWSEGKEQKAEDEWRFACDNINPGQVFDGCSKYKDMDWLRKIRRWPPVMVQHMEDFLKLRSV